MTYTWWIHPKRTTAIMRRIQSRINLLRYSQSTDISGTGENNTPDDGEDNEDPVEPTSEQDEREDGRVSPNAQSVNEDSEDNNYLPPSKDEVSLGDEYFIVPEEPVEQERF